MHTCIGKLLDFCFLYDDVILNGFHDDDVILLNVTTAGRFAQLALQRRYKRRLREHHNQLCGYECLGEWRVTYMQESRYRRPVRLDMQSRLKHM